MSSDLSGQEVKGYQLREQIGAGGFGEVYRAYQASVRREVAIKIILPRYANHPEFIRRFEAEARLVARLEHFHIVPLYDYWREPDRAYLVMRWLGGGSLHDSLEKGPWPPNEALRLLEQIASALAVAHRSNVVHRDMKPGNILLDGERNAYLADFGIATEVQAGSEPLKGDAIVGSPAYISPEQVRSEEATPLSDLYSLGIVLYEMLTGQHPFADASPPALLFKHLSDPVPHLRELRPELPDALNDVIQQATAKKPEERYSDVLALARAFRKALRAGVEPAAPPAAGDEIRITWDLPTTTGDISDAIAVITPAPVNPYKGLRAFQEADSPDFFGREALVEHLLARLRGDGDAHRFLAVVGPSGSGKSSVVRAGLIPALRRGALPGSAGWFMVDMLPGPDPFGKLAVTLLSVAVNVPDGLEARLREDERGLSHAVRQVLPAADAELVLVIDQFEELFTLCADEDLRARFLDSLLYAVTDPHSRLRLVITLRADFYDRPLLYPTFGELVRKHTEVVVSLAPEEMKKAVSGPAERVGLFVEPGLATRIVADIGEQPGTLPLLQYALTELYERRAGRALKLEAYEESGGVLGALARRAEELFAALDADSQALARQLFLRLVAPGEGTEDARRRVRQTELIAIRGGGEAMEAIIETFGKYRLLTFDHDPLTREPTVEVAHEALIRTWGRLRGWIDASREDLRLQRRLAAAAEEWVHSGRDPSYLAMGARLEQFGNWAATTDLAATHTEAAYLEASITERKQREAHEAEPKAREDALERRSRNRLRMLVVVLTVATVVALALMASALQQRQWALQAQASAERQAAEVHSLALAGGAQRALTEGNPDLAMALILEASRIDQPPPEVQSLLASAAYAPGTRRLFAGHRDTVDVVAFSPDGRTILSGGADGTLRLWDVATGEERLNLQHEIRVFGAAFSPDGRLVATGNGNVITLWDVASGERIRVWGGHTNTVFDLAFTPDGAHILSSSEDGTLRLWDVQTGEQRRRYGGHSGSVYSLDISADGRLALSGAADGTMRLWDLATGEAVRVLEGHQTSVYDVAFVPGAEMALSGSEDGTLILWDLQSGQVVHRLEGHTGWVNSVAVSPDGRLALSGSADESLILWDLNTGDLVSRLLGHDRSVEAVAFSPMGNAVLSGGRDYTVRLWNTNYRAEVRRFVGHQDNVNAVALSPDGRLALSGSRDTSLILWDVNTGAQIRRLEGHTDTVYSLAFSPDGQQALSGARDRSLILWDVATGQALRHFEGHDDTVFAVAFSPDGQQALSGSRDHSLILWDVATGEILRRWVAHDGPVLGVGVRPDGRAVLSAGDDHVLILWDLERGAEIRRFRGHTDAVTSAVFSPDDRLVLSGSDDRSVRLWDADTGEEIGRFEGHDSDVNAVALSPGERLLALSASADNTLILWDVLSQERMWRLEGHTNDVTGVVFSPDGQTALSSSQDGTLRLWRIDTLDELIAWTRANRYVRELTCQEREQYRVEPFCE